MVAMGMDEEEERRMHQGCMAGFLHLFDRPQILSGKRLHHQPRRLLSSSSGSATPSERSMQLADRSPDMPAAPRPSLQLPPMVDVMKDGGGGAPAVWRLPRLSLDSRAVVDANGKLRPREIRTSPSPGAPPSPGGGAGGDERRSPSVVARLMGLDALPHDVSSGGGDEQGGAACRGGELRRSASERVVGPRDPSRFRFVDPRFFERPSPPATPMQQQQRPSSPAAEVMRRAPDPVCPRGLQRRSWFDAHDVFPEPAKRGVVDPAVTAAGAGHGGEIALYGEIERRLRKRGIAEPARDLETLKQILEALQLKGLLRHTPPPPAVTPSVRNHSPPPPIVVMRPSSRPPQPATRTSSPTRRLPRVDVDTVRRPRSPDHAASPAARSPASPARRGPQSPQRRFSPAQSPSYQPPLRKPPTGGDARSRIGRRAGQIADDDASTTFSDGGSSGSLSASSRWDFEQRARPDEVRSDRGLLERCGKLLSSIEAFTASDDQQQPSPVSVLDAAAFLADEDSPPSSSGSKRAIFFGGAPGGPRAATASSDPEDDEWAHHDTWILGPDAASSDPDYAYVAEVVRLLDRMAWDRSDVYTTLEKTRGSDDTCHHRRLLCGAAAEVLDRRRSACAWDPVTWLRGAELVEHVWAEVRRLREPVAAPDSGVVDLNELICGGVVRDLAVDDGRWPMAQQRRVAGPEVADAVLQVERLVFKDLVADTIRELADVDPRLPRRKLVF